MKLIRTVDAEGAVLCHDITQIIKGVTKDAVFRKGHIVKKEDIPVLLSVGKDQLYVWEQEEGILHENDAAEILCAMCLGEHMGRSQVKEGKIEILAEAGGLLKVDEEGLKAVNSFGEMMIATRHGNTAVRKGDKLAGTRVIPLTIPDRVLRRAEAVAGRTPLLSLRPWKRKTAAIVVTGNEVSSGRIQDTFSPVVVDKLAAYSVETTSVTCPGDGTEQISGGIAEARKTGADIILCTGGMSVDPDDSTPGGIRAAGANVISYGAPVLPGAMFLLGYFEDGTPVLGLPGCVMYAGATIFDLILPRIVADVPVTKADLASMGEGGLCLGCEPCRYPVCPFGK